MHKNFNLSFLITGCNCLIRKNIVIERLMKPAKIINDEKIDEEKISEEKE